MRQPRSRPRIALALAGVVVFGLISRSGHALVPELCAQNAGDALWTVAAYCALAFVAPTARPSRIFLAAFGISVAVEVSQLATWAPLEAARRTLPGRLLLGQGWQTADLARYFFGALLALVLDRLALTRLRDTEPAES